MTQKELDDEDKRIRSVIINHLKDCNFTELAAWFEKQGKQTQEPCEKCEHPMLNCHNFPCYKKKAFTQGKTALEAIH